MRLLSPSPATRRSLVGGLPSHDVPAFALVRRGAAESTATRPRLGTLRPGAAMPELPTNACLPILTRSIAQPAAAELVAAEQGVVGEERAVVDRGQLGDQQDGGRLDVAARSGRRGARSQAGVSVLE